MDGRGNRDLFLVGQQSIADILADQRDILADIRDVLKRERVTEEEEKRKAKDFVERVCKRLALSADDRE
jgi:hypothetical protein